MVIYLRERMPYKGKYVSYDEISPSAVLLWFEIEWSYINTIMSAYFSEQTREGSEFNPFFRFSSLGFSKHILFLFLEMTEKSQDFKIWSCFFKRTKIIFMPTKLFNIFLLTNLKEPFWDIGFLPSKQIHSL